MVFHPLMFARSRERSCKLRPKADACNISHGTWQVNALVEFVIDIRVPGPRESSDS